MDYRIIYDDADGRCRIVTPDDKFQQVTETSESALARLYEVALPGVVEFLVCTPDKIPQDKTFRDAWKKGDKNEPIKVDFDKAISIHRERLQAACERKIAQLNQELEIALENDNLPQQVAIRRTKKILRTLQNANLTHCKTVEDIKNSIPNELKDVWSCTSTTQSV